MAALHLLTGISELLTMPLVPRDRTAEAQLGLIRDAAIALDEAGSIAWFGARDAAPDAARVTDLGGRVVCPGLVDCHTHLVFAGDRARDFEARCRGESYVEVAARGGGIRSTVAATRAATELELVASAGRRLGALLARGVTTVEIKSGYGLSEAAEMKQLRVIRAAGAAGDQRIVATLLAAHVVPDEFADDREGYVSLVTEVLVPRVAREGLADHVDVFCDRGAFTLKESLAVLDAARAAGLGFKAHGEQLSATGIAAAAALRGALSVDHCEHVDPEGIAAMAAGGTVAVLLPAASIYLGDRARPPVAAFRAAGVPMALATDCNPGSSPTTNIWLVVTLGCAWYGMHPAEALRAVTVEAARALGLAGTIGTVAVGAPGDLAVCAVPGWRHLAAGYGDDPVVETWIAGERAFWRSSAG